ncbi:MAG TPA: VCBS repeat-containing protein [Planctomycetota bacterium]|nr:VCBS repeat-containing protein [Planctomycetota bacterium]
MMRRMLARVMFLLLVFLLPALSSAAKPAPILEFKLSWLAVYGRRESTLNYDFNGDGKLDILGVSINFDTNPPERWLSLHYQNKNGEYSESPDVMWPVADNACALVIGDFLPGGGTEIGFIAEDGVYVYPWEKGRPAEKPIKLIHVRTFFRTPSLKQLPLWQWKMDLSGDGLDDIIVPLPDGYRVYFQTAPGIFGKTATLESDLPATVPKNIAVSNYAANPEVSPSQFVSYSELPRLEIVDINGDGLSDLVMIRKEEVSYYLQGKGGKFPSTRASRFAYGIESLRGDAKKDNINLALVKFVDINGDGIADLVVTKIEGQLGLFESIKTSIYIHLGTGRGNFIPGQIISIDGVSIDPEFIDMNGDGKLDVVTSRLRTDLFKQAANAAIFGDVAITYEVFQFDPVQNLYLKDPVYDKQILVARKDLEKTGAGAVPLLFIRGDVTGDGRPDLIAIDPKTNELNIHPGREKNAGAGPRIDFDGTAHYSIKIDRHPKGLQLMDVNGDGISDIILYYNGAVGLITTHKR